MNTSAAPAYRLPAGRQGRQAPDEDYARYFSGRPPCWRADPRIDYEAVEPAPGFCIIAVREDFREFFKREKIKVGKECAITGLMFPTNANPVSCITSILRRRPREC